MSYTVAASQTNWFSAGGAQTVSYTPSATGNYILLVAGGGNAVGPFTVSATYALLTGGVNGGTIPQSLTGAMYAFGAVAPSTSTISVTVTGASGHPWGYQILEFTTGNSSWTLDGASTNTYTGASSGAFPSITPTQSDSLWVGTGTLLNPSNTTLTPATSNAVSFQTQPTGPVLDTLYWYENTGSSVYAPTIVSNGSLAVASSVVLFAPHGSQIVMWI